MGEARRVGKGERNVRTEPVLRLFSGLPEARDEIGDLIL